MKGFKDRLRELEEENLLRTIRDRQSPQGARITIGGRSFINFASNDYLGLASHPSLAEGAREAIERYGSGAGASRLLSGGCELHAELEAALAEFKATEKTLLFNSGYCLNTGAIPALAGEEGAIFSDELNHASIIDGTRLSRAKTYIYRHKDVSHLARLLEASDAEEKLIVTDSVFSMDGDIAPLKELYELCSASKGNVMLFIDDAHAMGVLGDGRGSLAHFGIAPEPCIIQMGTLSKALGSFGAFVAGESDVIDWIVNSARSFIFTTALPPPVVGASLSALKLISADAGLVRKLWENREMLASELRSLGLDTGESQSPIIPIIMNDIEETMSFAAYLYERGIYAPAIRPPSVKTPRIRLTITASHTRDDIGSLAEAVGKWQATCQ